MNFSLIHYRIKYFKNNNCFSSSLNFFSGNASFLERFPEKSSRFHSNADITKRNSNVHFNPGNTGHAPLRLAVTASFILL